MEPKEALMELGLTKTETSVYLALLQLGPCTLAQITKQAALHRANAHAALESLGEKGLAALSIKNEKKLYRSSDPVLLRTMVEEKLSLVNKLLPQLAIEQSLHQQQTEVMLYEGADALRGILNAMLEMADERVVFGVPKTAPELFRSFLDEYHQKRIRAGKRLRHIYNFDARERMAYLNNLPLTESRYLPEEYDSPVATSVCGEIVMLTLWQKKPVSIVIKNKDVAAAYKRYFEFLWKQARKL